MYYVAHRLFAAHDRMLGALVAKHLAALVGTGAVFLPFCDTDEEDLVAAVKGKRLYELDVQRLGELSGMLAVLHGPSLDDGVCMEIGYAAARGVPVVVLTTDFVTHGVASDSPPMPFPEPLLEAVVADVVRVPRLGRGQAAGDRYYAYLQRNHEQIRRAVETAVTRLLELGPPAGPASTAGNAAQPIVFYEPSPYWDDPLWPGFARHLQQRGYRPLRACRFSSGGGADVAGMDWARAADAGLLVADVSGPETPPGAALLIGACAARGQRILAVAHRRSWTFADGREPNWRNLMIQYSVDAQLPDLSGADLLDFR